MIAKINKSGKYWQINEKNSGIGSSAAWDIFLGFVFWDGVSGKQNKGAISESF